MKTANLANLLRNMKLKILMLPAIRELDLKMNVKYCIINVLMYCCHKLSWLYTRENALTVPKKMWLHSYIALFNFHNWLKDISRFPHYHLSTFSNVYSH